MGITTSSLAEESLPARPSRTEVGSTFTAEQKNIDRGLIQGRSEEPCIQAALTLQDPLVCQARQLAHQGFQGRFRKLPPGSSLIPLPYVAHLEDVAQVLAGQGANAVLTAAGYLHDHIEDLIDWNFARLASECHPRVAELVDWVTEQDQADSWENRKQNYQIRLQLAPPAAKMLAAADKISNLRSSIHLMQRGFPVKSYLVNGWGEQSKRYHELLPVLSESVTPALLTIYQQQLNRFDKLGKLLSQVK